MKTLVFFAFVTLFIRIQGNPVPDFFADCPEGSGDCSPAPPPTPPSPPTGNPPSPASCGDRPSSGARIVGGHETAKNSIPWQAMLRTERAQFCGGSLVHKQWVLTAAHCVEGSSPDSFKIWLGAHHINTEEPGTTQEIRVDQVVIHPGYDTSTSANDMALIKLRQEAVLGKGVGLICLGDDALHLPIDDLNNQCLISGWGTLESGGDQPDTLQEVLVPLVSKQRCERAYGSLHDSMLCAGFDEGGKDSCQGDSGGPLACQYNGKYYIEGATSWGSGCAGANAYGVYAKVRELRAWIDQHIQG